jgi:hypothetical protein
MTPNKLFGFHDFACLKVKTNVKKVQYHPTTTNINTNNFSFSLFLSKMSVLDLFTIKIDFGFVSLLRYKNV